MRICTLIVEGNETAALTAPQGLVLMETINSAENKRWHTNLFDILTAGQLDEINNWYREEGKRKLENLTYIPKTEAEYAPLYRHPRKIWGIGMNYVETPEELERIAVDSEPVSFMKPDTTIIGLNEPIRLPPQSELTTAEAELVIIIGKACRNISEAEAEEFVAGFTTSLDMTAADIHQKNPRFLTRAKSFDTFFSFGPELVTKDEIPDVLGLEVRTGLNGQICHSNTVFNMRYRPWFTVSFHSKVMTLLPGDIILTGTPGPVVIRGGDIAECHIEGFETLVNPVLHGI